MRKLITALSFASFAIAGVTGLTAPSAADESGLRVVHEYPNPAISDQNRPIFASDMAWFKNGGTLVSDMSAGQRPASQIAGSPENRTGPLNQRVTCFRDLDDEGEPLGPMHPSCY